VNIKKLVIVVSLMSIVAGAYFVREKYVSKHENYEQAVQVFENSVEELLSIQEKPLLLSVAVKTKPIIEVASPEMLQDILTYKKEPAILFFHMNGCGWCKKMEPVYEQVAQQPAFASIQFYSVNGIDCNAPVVVKELTDQQITGYPFLIFMNENGYLDKQSGFAKQEDFEQKIKTILFNAPESQAPILLKKEVEESDNVVIQSCVSGVGDGCTGHAGNNHGTCCEENSLICSSCQGKGKVLASDGQGGWCQNSSNAQGQCGVGSSNENESNPVCVGAAGNIVGGTQNTSSGDATGCAPGYVCITSLATGTPYPAKTGTQGICTACGYYSKDETECMWSGEVTGYRCFNQQQCTGGATSVVGSGSKNSTNSAGACCSGYVCLSTSESTTTAGSTAAGSMLQEATTGQIGACFITTGIETTITGQTTTVDGNTVEVYTSGGASGTYGQSGMCSAGGQVCVGAFEGALGTCCQDQYVTDCMVDSDTIATYAVLGTCMKSQQSGGMSSCTGGATGNQGTCPEGYACVYDNGTSIAQTPSGWTGYCAVDNGKYGTQNQCNISGQACLGAQLAGAGTCCPADEGQEDLSCLVSTSSATTESEYAEYGEIGACQACSETSCTGNGTNNQGNCCPNYACNTTGTSNINAVSGQSGTCVKSNTTTNCATNGQSCTYVANSTQGSCCTVTGSVLVCVQSNVPGNKGYGVAITTGAGMCMAE